MSDAYNGLVEGEKMDHLTMAIESSCDETSVAIVRNGREILSNIISSQIEVHKVFGGVVPEIASRHHLKNINGVAKEALEEAGVTLDDIDLIGVTQGPGLVGALLIGLATAKAFAFAKNKPLVGVHHIQGHISANYIEHKELEPPFLAIVVSGGQEMMQRGKPLTRWQEFLALGIQVDRLLTKLLKKAIKMPSILKGFIWRKTVLTLVSAGPKRELLII